MKTGNALEGYVCPRCGTPKLLLIRGEAVFAVRKDSIQLHDQSKSIEWGNGAYARCSCGYEGTVRDFRPELHTVEDQTAPDKPYLH